MPTNVSLNQLLSAPQITRVISQIKTPQSRLQDALGMGPGGSNQNTVGGHFAGYDIFDRTRSLARGRAPGTGPATVAPQIIGHVPVTMYRSHEKIHILEERVFRTRPLGKNFGPVDIRGQKYVAEQEQYVAQRFKNTREFMVSRMLRGKFGLLRNGDDWEPVEAGSGTFDIDYQIPAANKSQLNMLGAGSIIAATWATLSTDIQGHVLGINAANEQLHGRQVRHFWTDSTILNLMLNNTKLQAQGGTANTVFQEYGRTGFRGPDGMPDTGFEVVFRAMPWLTVHSYDAGLVVYGGAGTTEDYGGEHSGVGTFTKFFPGTTGVFMPDPDSSWCEYYVGSEIVVENVMHPGVERFGLATWVERTTQPAGWELLVVDNGLPVLYVPKCIQYATLTGF